MRAGPQTPGPTLMRDKTENLVRTHFVERANLTHILWIKYRTGLYEAR